MIQKLFSGKYLVGRGRQKIKKLQLLGGHFHGTSPVSNRVVRQIDNQIRIFHVFALVAFCWNRRSRNGLISPQDSLYPCNQLLGIKGLDHIIICSQLQSQNLIKNLALCRKHNNRHLRNGSQFPANLIAVNSRQHQIQKNQIGTEIREYFQRCFSVIDNLRFVAFLHKIKRNQFRNILIVIYD